MDFLKKAKAKVAEAEELANKYKAQMNLGEKKPSQSEATPTSPPASTAGAPSESPSFATSAGSSSAQTPGSSSANTSVPFSTSPTAPKKLPMTARKSIRDDFEHKLPQLEERIFKALKTKWTFHVDAPAVYSYSSDTEARWASENPGNMFFSYFNDGGIRWIEMFLQKFGDDGRESINRLASSHTMTLEPADDPSIRYCSCDFRDGKLRLVFNHGMLGMNSNDACEDLTGAINKASAASEAGAGAGGGAALSISARNGIRTGYEAHVAAEQEQARALLQAPTLSFVPNFDPNYAKLKAYAQSDPEQKPNRDWESLLGSWTLGYFKGFNHMLDYRKFKKDEMLQEGFKDLVEKNEVALKVVEPPLPGGKRYNSIEIEEGVFVIKTTPAMWGVNSGDACEGIVDLL